MSQQVIDELHVRADWAETRGQHGQASFLRGHFDGRTGEGFVRWLLDSFDAQDLEMYASLGQTPAEPWLVRRPEVGQ